MPGAETLSGQFRFSVIVASCNSPETLELCLESLERQVGPGGEIIVADCSDQDPRRRFRRAFPAVRFLRFDHKRTIPELRREAIKAAKGSLLLLTEGRMIPSNHWAASLGDAHATHPNAPAVGGPIDHLPASAFDDAVFFCEYGLHLPPDHGPARELSGANLSYKAWAVDLCRDLLEQGAWEPFWHRRLEQSGHRLLREGKALVYYRNTLTARQFFRQRLHYGRWFAAERIRGLRRFLYAALCPVLPLLLTIRLGRVAVRRGRARRFLRSLPWILAFQAVWSLGEFFGYTFGRGNSHRQVF